MLQLVANFHQDPTFFKIINTIEKSYNLCKTTILTEQQYAWAITSLYASHKIHTTFENEKVRIIHLIFTC